MASPTQDAEMAPVRRRFGRRLMKAGIIALVGLLLAFFALLWPGWPLRPLAAFASWRARSEGLALRIRSPWLRIHTDLTARLEASEIRLGDTANPEALSLQNLAVQWRLGDLAHGRLAPESVRLGEASATLRADDKGRLQFLVFPSSPASSAAPVFTPADLPANALPGGGRALSLTIDRARLHLPAGLPAREIATGPITFTLSHPKAVRLDFTGSLDLRVDGRPGSAQFEGQLALVHDWLGRFRARLSAAPSADAPATRVTIVIDRADAAKPAAVSLRVNDCAPGDWLALLGRKDLPRIAGRLDAEVEARGDPVRRRLDFASARIATDALTLTQPSLLVRPLTVAPVQIAFQTEDNGARGKLEPFTIQAGPLSLDCSGVTWEAPGAAIAGSGKLRLAAVPLVALLDWLPPDVRGRLPLTAEEAAEIGIAATTLDLAIAGKRAAGLPGFRFATRGGLNLNRELVAIEADGDLDAATRLFNLKIVLPDFVQARWQLALLRRFPVPDLAAPLRAEFNLRGHWPDTLDEARWNIVAGQGHVVPKGPALRWLARPFPVTSFALAGNLHEGQKHLTIEQLDLVSGRARLSVGRTELDSTGALTATTGTAATSARLSLKLEHWYASDFLPLLGPELLAVVKPAAEDLAQIGLERLETGAVLTFSHLPWIDPALTTLDGTQSAVFRVGDERIPVDAVWKYDPASRRVVASLQLKDVRPDRLTLALLKNLPIPPSVFDLAFAINAEVSADPYAKSLDLMKLRAAVRVSAEGGRIKANPLLAADLPVARFLMEASAQILPLRLESLKVSADFDGPTLLIDDARIDFGETGRGGLRLALRELPLDWAYARVPAAWRPAPLKDAQVRGRLVKLDLRAEFPTPTAKTPAPLPTALALSAELRDFGLRLADCPEVALPRLDLSGDLDNLTLLVDRASTEGIVLSGFKAAVATPLSPAGRATAAGTVEADLSRVPALLAAARRWVALPPTPDLTGLAGKAAIGFTASSPLDPAKIPTDIRATAKITAQQVVAPAALLPAAVRLGPSAFALDVEVAGRNATGTVNWRPASLDVAPWIAGAPALDATFALAPQFIELHPRLDLAATVIDVPQLCWHKSVGLPAAITTDARLSLRTPATPARLNATVTTEGLVMSPLRTRVEADLGDDTHPALNLLPGVASVQLRETVIGRSTLELDATRAADGATRLDLRSPLVDLADWISLFAPAIKAWDKAQATAAAAPVAADTKTTAKAKTAPPPPAPAPAAAIPVLPLPALNLNAAIARVSLAPSQQLADVSLAATLRDGLPASLKLTAAAGDKTTLDLQLDPAAKGRLPWRCNLVNLGGWLRAATSPFALLAETPATPGSPLEALRTLPDTFASGDIALQGTADWRDTQNTFDGSFHIDRLVLAHELQFLSKIAALIKKRVILQVPFKVFDVPAFTATPTSLSLKKMRIQGPLTLTSEHLNLDFAAKEIDMSGKVLGIGFDVAGPLSNPRFYLTDKNVLFNSVTTKDDFDW